MPRQVAALQCVIAQLPGDRVERPTFAFDGSFGEKAGGWGVILLEPSGSISARKGPLVLGPPTTDEFLVDNIYNNTAELAAIVAACRWAVTLSPPPRSVNFLFDSLWASCCARGIWRARKNSTVVDAARRALEKLAEMHIDICWSHVRAHRGHFLNDLADLAAKLALGTSSSLEVDLPMLQTSAEGPLKASITRHLQSADQAH